MTAQRATPKWRKMLISGAIGAVVSYAGMAGWMTLVKSGALGDMGRSAVIASVVGLVYLLTAAIMGLGVANVRLGARVLNVEDEEELREQRRMLLFSCAGMAAMGLGLIVLALGGAGGVLTPGVALVSMLALFAGAVTLSGMQWRLMDELMRSVSREAGNTAFYLLTVVGGGWAALAHFGFAPAPAPLDWLTMIAVFLLASAFIVTGRRGMLAPR